MKSMGFFLGFFLGIFALLGLISCKTKEEKSQYLEGWFIAFTIQLCLALSILFSVSCQIQYLT